MTLAIVASLARYFGLSGWTSTSVASDIDATGRSSLILFFDGFCGFECATPLAVIPESVDAAKQELDPPMSPPFGHEVVDDPWRGSNLDAERTAFVRALGAQLFG